MMDKCLLRQVLDSKYPTRTELQNGKSPTHMPAYWGRTEVSRKGIIILIRT